MSCSTSRSTPRTTRDAGTFCSPVHLRLLSKWPKYCRSSTVSRRCPKLCVLIDKGNSFTLTINTNRSEGTLIATLPSSRVPLRTYVVFRSSVVERSLLTCFLGRRGTKEGAGRAGLGSWLVQPVGQCSRRFHNTMIHVLSNCCSSYCNSTQTVVDIEREIDKLNRS